MKFWQSFSKIFIAFSLCLMVWKCEDPINSDLGHGDLNIDTLSFSMIDFKGYSVAPNLSSSDRLYLGKKANLHVPISFVRIGDAFKITSDSTISSVWDFYYDSTVVIDSLHFILYSNDSIVSQNSNVNLYFSPDSQFDENSSNFLDFSNFSTDDWEMLGTPSILTKIDSLGAYESAEYIWEIDTLLSLLSDTLDSNLTRTFAIKLAQDDTNFMEFFSEEATTGEKDPKIIMYYTQTTSSGDSISIDTNSVKIFSSGDLTIIDPTDFISDTTYIDLGNGIGSRGILNFPFIEETLPIGSVIRSANLILNYDTTLSASNHNIVIDPIEGDSVDINSMIVYQDDPLISVGYPYRVSSYISNGQCIISIKNIIQNLNLGNIDNFGFKLVSNEKNDPFEVVFFNKKSNNIDARLEIIFVTNNNGNN